MANDFLHKTAMRVAIAEFDSPGAPLLTWAQLKAQGPTGLADGSLDAVQSCEGGRCLGSGAEVFLDQRLWRTIQARVLECILQNFADGAADRAVARAWTEAFEQGQLRVWQHTQAAVPCRGTVMTSKCYTRSRTRDGTLFFLPYYDRRGNMKNHVGEASYYLRLEHHDVGRAGSSSRSNNTTLAPLRFVVGRLFSQTTELVGGDSSPYSLKVQVTVPASMDAAATVMPLWRVAAAANKHIGSIGVGEGARDVWTCTPIEFRSGNRVA